MKKGLVSLITPCYNGENLIHRLLDSVLEQDYPQIEMFVVDDGSTDNSKKVILSYIDKFQAKGYKLTYIYQENAGQAVAINNALKLVKGEFLAWPDCDDFYSSNTSINKSVELLSKLDSSYGMVFTLGNVISEQTWRQLPWNLNSYKYYTSFEDCVKGKFLMIPINYLVRMKAFDKTHPQRNIYTGGRPQNIQMILPLLYSYRAFVIEEPLCTILVRDNSDSHSKKTLSQKLIDVDGYIRIYCNTINNIQEMADKSKNYWKTYIRSQFLNAELSLCITDKNKDRAKEVVNKMKSEGVSMDLRGRVRFFLFMYCSILSRVINI